MYLCIMDKTKKYCVYIHKKKTDGEVFYVGKGIETRPYNTKHRSDWWIRIEKKYGRDVEIITDGLTNDEAIQLEIKTIAKYGRLNLGTGTLCNMTDGGEGGFGLKHTDESKKLMSEAAMGNTRFAGKKHTEQTKEFMSEIHMGKKNHMFGKKLSEKHKKAILKANIGSKRSEESKLLMSLNNKGKKRVIDTVSKIEYNSITEAAKAIGINMKTLSAQLIGTYPNKTNLKYI